MDLILYSDAGTIVDQSQDKTADEEPKAAQAPFTISVAPNTVYYPATWVFTTAGVTLGSTGYQMVITAY
jgi:hypothetical protein